MRLGSVFKMRMSILNTATTEHLGCIICFFFVYYQIYKSVIVKFRTIRGNIWLFIYQNKTCDFLEK
nr:hypothetical protein [uncultured Anaerobutyricum sp.]